MISDPLVNRWGVISTTQRALRYGGASLRDVPGLLKQIIREDMWHEYLAPSGEVMHFASFNEFLVSEWGLSTTFGMVQRICGEDIEALDLLVNVTGARAGAKEGNQNAARSATITKRDEEQQPSLLSEQTAETIVDNVNNCFEKDHIDGNGRAYALRRLRTERPDIHARVLRGELSPHRGMIEAGFRHQPTSLEILQSTWRKVSPADRLRFLIETLTPAERRVISTGLIEEEEHADE